MRRDARAAALDFTHLCLTSPKHLCLTSPKLSKVLLQQIEQSRDPEALVALFAQDAELLNLALTEPMRGIEGARKFWTNYLSAFEEIRSEFHHVIETDRDAVLEWVSEGLIAGSGQAFNYRGVSVIEHDGAKVQRFRTYYDSAVFLPGGAKHKETM